MIIAITLVIIGCFNIAREAHNYKYSRGDVMWPNIIVGASIALFGVLAIILLVVHKYSSVIT